MVDDLVEIQFLELLLKASHGLLSVNMVDDLVASGKENGANTPFLKIIVHHRF